MNNMTNSQYEECIKACLECLEACNTYFTSCLKEEHIDLMRECIKLDRECTDICGLAITAMQTESRHMKEICALCALMCKLCAEECTRHDHEHCQKCAEACRKCAQVCEKWQDEIIIRCKQKSPFNGRGLLFLIIVNCQLKSNTVNSS